MNKYETNKISTDQESDTQIDCSCQILNDTSLSDVGDSDCSCSECLEANLNAFNELKELQEEQQTVQYARSLNKVPTAKSKLSKTSQNQKQPTKTVNRFDKNNHQSPNKRNISKTYTHTDQIQLQKQPRINKFTRQDINDYILITRQRTRQYMNQRNQLKNQDQKLKDELKSKIKQNLQILKYTAKSIRDNNYHAPVTHTYKWNHAPAVSSEIQHIRKSKNQCKSKLKERQNQRKKVDTNLQKLLPQFKDNPSQFLQEIKQKRIQKFKQCKGCPYDHCPNHHMRTSKKKLQQIQKFIMKKTKQHIEKVKNQKKAKQQKEKVKQAKLRAIEIRSKDALKRSKKYDPSESRSSFHLTIDHFSTFSDLRDNKKQKDDQKQHRKQVKKMMKEKGGKLQQAIYEEEFPNQPEIQPIVKEKSQKLQSIIETKKQYCQRITKDAKIYSPKKVKPEDEKYLKDKKEKKKKTMNQNVEKNKAKQIALEIERKKYELMEEYNKQKLLKESKNQKVKVKFSQTLQKIKY